MVAWVAPVASLVGGIFSSRSKRKAQNRQNAYNNPSAIRARFEKAGFNPLLGMNNPSALQQPVGDHSMMGDSIARAGLSYAEGKTEEQRLKIEKSRLEMQNKALEADLQKTRLQPPVPGVYQQKKKEAELADIDAPWQEMNFLSKKAFVRPKARPDQVKYQPVRLPDGQLRMVERTQMQRLQIKPWQTISAGDYAEIVGELRGEGETALAFSSIGKHSGIKFFPTVEQKLLNMDHDELKEYEQRQEDRKNLSGRNKKRVRK